jgi:uncharacterized NAD(P)/FAD-binding protein YdhS
MEERSDNELEKLGVARADINERAFFPRVALGGYFHAQLEELRKLARKRGNALLIKTNHKVLDINLIENSVELTVREDDGTIGDWTFDYAVMATGHSWPKETEVSSGYFLSPWPARALKDIGNCHVGIRGTSLSAIDAMVALCVARGSFERDEQGKMYYLSEPGTEDFSITMMSRKGLLPEADFYHPIPYEPLSICSKQAIKRLINRVPREELLDAAYKLFKEELAGCDPDYAKHINLMELTLEEFSRAYFAEREENDSFEWAARNLKEAQMNHQKEYTVPWRYAILRMHENIAQIAPHLPAEDHKRFNKYFKSIFVDDYATVPHESIERVLAVHAAGKLDIIRLEDNYILETKNIESGAVLIKDNKRIHFPAFIEATGQRSLSIHEFPFPGLWEQGVIQKATAPDQHGNEKTIGGIAVDKAYHPVSEVMDISFLYCLSIPFILGQFPFAQGITSSHDMGKKVADDILFQLADDGDLNEAFCGLYRRGIQGGEYRTA